MKKLVVVAAVCAVSALGAGAGSADAASGTWESAWGKSVLGGSGDVCFVAASCGSGESGTGAGVLDQPRDVAVDAAGNVYVTEAPNNRVEKFSPDGVFLRAWGADVSVTGGGTHAEICVLAADCTGAIAGTQGGEFDSPEGIAIDPAGFVYVADADNNRIQKFDLSGNFIAAWGGDVSSAAGTGYEICTSAPACQQGQPASKGGEMSDPIGLDVDASGDVWVADFGNGRIQELSTAGAFIKAVGDDVTLGAPTAPEVCADAAQCNGGATSGLGGGFNGVYDVAVAPDGDVYAEEIFGRRVQRLAPDGTFERAWGQDVDTSGNAGFEICTTAASCKSGQATSALGGNFDNPAAIEVDGAGSVYVSDNVRSRIQKFDGAGNFISTWGKDVDATGGTGFEICTIATNCMAGVPGDRGGEMGLPSGLGAGPGNSLFVADLANDRIQKFSDPPVPPGPQQQAPPPANPGPTGKRAAALKKCKKKRKKARKKCRKKARRLPL